MLERLISNEYFNLGRPRFLAQSAATTATTTTKTSTVTSRPGHTVSQSQPGSRSTSPNSLKSSHYLSPSLRTPTNARSRIPIGSNGGSRISSRESSPGRTRMLSVIIECFLFFFSFLSTTKKMRKSNLFSGDG